MRNMLALACLVVFLLGALCYCVSRMELPGPVAEPMCEQPVSSTAQNLLTQREWQVKEQEKQKHAFLFTTVKKVLAEFKKDSHYSGGVTGSITPRLVMAIVQKESSGNSRATSRCGARGLMQVMPLHAKGLHSAGIISSPKAVHELYDIKTNIRAGIYILLHYSKNSRSLEEALARYNGGNRVAAGRRYAVSVLEEYRRLKRQGKG